MCDYDFHDQYQFDGNVLNLKEDSLLLSEMTLLLVMIGCLGQFWYSAETPVNTRKKDFFYFFSINRKKRKISPNQIFVENIYYNMKKNNIFYEKVHTDIKQIKDLVSFKLMIKNPAYGRHGISRPMWIVGPIQFWRGCVIYL